MAGVTVKPDAIQDAARKLRVLHVSPYYAPAWGYGGIVESVSQLARHLALAGAEVRVLTTDANGSRRLSEREMINESPIEETCYCARRLAKSFAPSMLTRLPAMVRWADIVHLHAVYSFPTLPTLACARILNRPLAWTPRGALQRWQGSRRVALKTVWDRVAAAVSPSRMTLHLTSEQEARECAGYFPNAARIVVGNGVQIPERVARSQAADKLRVGFIGRLDPKKGIENLLEACAIIAERKTISLSLAIAGSGAPAYEQKLSRRVADLAQSCDVTMSAEVRGDAKEAWFAARDLVVVPSFTENFGNVVAEALVREVPVIASRGTPWQGLDEHGCGLWVANDPESLAAAIERIASMPLAEMGARGRAWMLEQYSWERCAHDMIVCYEEILRPAGRAAAQVAGSVRSAL